ncbi:MAG: hypothetical protein ACREN8_13715 [Candidatus Dormibacteraceae bacterium]
MSKWWEEYPEGQLSAEELDRKAAKATDPGVKSALTAAADLARAREAKEIERDAEGL